MRIYAPDLKRMFPDHKVTVSNGNAKYRAVCKIRDKASGEVLFETANVWRGAVSISQKSLYKLNTKLSACSNA